MVRNPWDRVVSLWCWMHEGKSGWHIPFDRWVRAGLEPNFVPGASFRITAPCSWWLNPTQAGPLKDHPAEVAAQGLRDADFVVRFERREVDLARLAAILNRPTPDLHVGRSERGPYRDYYSPITRDAVTDMYREDIELYEYEF